MTVVETDNQTTTASYTGGVQNDAEVSNLDLPDSCSGSKEDVDGALLQDDETKRLLGGHTNGTTKVCSSCILVPQLPSSPDKYGSHLCWMIEIVETVESTQFCWQPLKQEAMLVSFLYM